LVQPVDAADNGFALSQSPEGSDFDCNSGAVPPPTGRENGVSIPRRVRLRLQPERVGHLCGFLSDGSQSPEGSDFDCNLRKEVDMCMRPPRSQSPEGSDFDCNAPRGKTVPPTDAVSLNPPKGPTSTATRDALSPIERAIEGLNPPKGPTSTATPANVLNRRVQAQESQSPEGSDFDCNTEEDRSGPRGGRLRLNPPKGPTSTATPRSSAGPRSSPRMSQSPEGSDFDCNEGKLLAFLRLSCLSQSPEGSDFDCNKGDTGKAIDPGGGLNPPKGPTSTATASFERLMKRAQEEVSIPRRVRLRLQPGPRWS